MFQPTKAELERRASVVQDLREHISANLTIRLPRGTAAGAQDFALLALAAEPGRFGGSVGGYRYLFEGEDDLLHLFIVREDGAEFPVEEAQSVVAWLIPEVPPGLIWVKPGTVSHHFYFGHELLLAG